MIVTILALKHLREREHHRYLDASPEEKEKIKEEWGIIPNPTEEQLQFRQHWCELTNRIQSDTYGSVAAIITSLAAGFATLYYLKPNPESIEGLLPVASAIATASGVMYASMKIGNLLHRRKHPTGRECNDEYVQEGLELIAELENNHRRIK